MKALGIVWGAELGSYVPANTCMLNLISCGWSLVNLMRFYSRQKRREVRHGSKRQDVLRKAHNLHLLQISATSADFNSLMCSLVNPTHLCYLKLGVVKVHEGLPQVWSKFCHLQVLDSLSGRCCRTDFGLQIDCLWEAGSSGYLLHLWSGAWVCPPPDIRLPLRQAGLDCIPKYETTGTLGRAALNLCWDLVGDDPASQEKRRGHWWLHLLSLRGMHGTSGMSEIEEFSKISKWTLCVFED